MGSVSPTFKYDRRVACRAPGMVRSVAEARASVSSPSGADDCVCGVIFIYLTFHSTVVEKVG